MAWPMIRLAQRLSMVVTLACCVYVVFFLLSEKSSDVPMEAVSLPSPAFDLKASDAPADAPVRDIFSLDTAVTSTGTGESAPKGQLPEHLKIVGIVIAHPSQIIVEDSLAHKTYFIDEGAPQAGIKIMQVNKNQMTINYQGQDISVAIHKN